MRSVKRMNWKLIISATWFFFGISVLSPKTSFGETNIDSSEVNLQQPEKFNEPKIDTDTLISGSPEKTQQNTLEAQVSNKSTEPHNVINKVILQIYGKQNLYELKEKLESYGNKHLPISFRKIYIQVIDKTYTYPIIFLFIVLIFLFIFSATIVLFILYYTNTRMNRNERYVRIYKNLYEDVLRSYLFGEIDWEKASLKLKRITRRQNRKILTDVLFTFKENLRGDMDSLIPEIFLKLRLQNDSIKLATSSWYFRKVQGIKELTNLYPEGALKLVPNYLNDSHNLVRAESQVAYVRLHPEKPFEFLRSLSYPFSRWTQLSAFYIFRLHQLPIPAFVDYLDSRNANVRNFCLRMIIFFQQLENASEIFKLLDSKLESTRLLSIKAINDLRLYEGKEQIKKMYSTENETNKIEIIKALKNIGNDEDFDFLESIIRSGSVSQKTEACRSLYYISNQGKERLTVLAQTTDLEIEKFLAHIIDPRN